jgi:predicted amidohydrolase
MAAIGRESERLGASGSGGTEGWSLLELTMRAPEQAEMVELELWLRFAPGGRVWWRGAEVGEVPARAPRLVTLGTVRATPEGKSTLDANRRLLAQLAEQAAGAGAGIVCLPENAVFHATGLSYQEAAEPVPGPTTEVLSRVAAERRIWIVGQVIERQEHRLYNSAVLVDREGRIAAVYHKMHPTTGELECGVVPGAGPVVAETDFGRVGLLVCYDLHFPESARLTAQAGAEVIFGPTVGDRWPERRDAVTRAHAVTNGVFVVTSLVNHPSDIVDPEGRLLATASEPNSVATARVNLDYKETVEGRLIGPAGGQHPGVYWAERRPDLKNVPDSLERMH